MRKDLVYKSFIALSLLFATKIYAQVGNGNSFGSPWGIASEADGTLVVTDDESVIRIDPFTGDRSTLSGPRVGSGPELNSSEGIAVEADGSLVVNLRSRISRIDPVTGDRTIVSSSGGPGSGPAFSYIREIAIEADGSLVVTDSGQRSVVRVDPVTGDRTTVSDNISTGSGPRIEAPVGIAVRDDGFLLVTDTQIEAIVLIDPITGDRTILSDTNTGSGPDFVNPIGITIRSDGQLLVANLGSGGSVDLSQHSAILVDSTTGDRTILSNITTGSGPNFVAPRGILEKDDGFIIVVDNWQDALIKVEPATGDRSFLSVYRVDNEENQVQLAAPSFSMSPSYPNPFHSSTVVNYILEQPEEVNVDIYDVLGRHIETLVNGFQMAGQHRIQWNSLGNPSGLYWIRIQVDTEVKSQRLIRL